VTDLLALTEEFCAIPSVSGDEDALADAVETRLRKATPVLEVTRIGANVVARTQLGRERRIVLGGHLDTVPSNGNAQPRRDGDVLHGLGTADMKGGLAVLCTLADAAAAASAPLRHDLTFIFYEGEEIADEHNGLRRLFAERPDLVAGDLAILLEPTGGWLEAGCQGTIHVRATFRGARAHSARPWMGTNAIHRAAPLLARLASFDAATVEVDGLEYREALQVVRVQGGVANNVVPDECALVCNRRYAPNRSLEDAVAEMRALVADADEIEVLNASPAAEPFLNHPLVAELCGVYDLPVRAKLGWTDVARFAAHGIPACNFGPGDPELAHTANERVDAVGLDLCHRVLANFLGLAANS
jgi:succinyl-diaminopimelate desuccinylase